MREPDFLSTSMTKLETPLKSFYLQRPDLQNKIITSAELSGYISWIIRQCTGLSYAHLVLKMKMEKAATLLRYGHTSTTKIATDLGYSDVSCFYRAFTKYYQKTPMEYVFSKQPRLQKSSIAKQKSSQSVNTAYSTGGFRIYLSPYFINYDANLCKTRRFIRSAKNVLRRPSA